MDTLKLTELSTDDLTLYFHGTLVKVNLKDRIFPGVPANLRKTFKCDWAKIRAFDHGHVNFEVQTTEGISYVMVKLANDLFSWEFPQTGFYNFKGTAVQFFRKNRRQNKKGLCSENTTFLNFTSVLKEIKGWPSLISNQNNFEISQGNLTLLFNSKYDKFDSAYKKIMRGSCIAKAVDPYLCLSLGLQDKSPSLWLGKSYVGRMVSPKEVLLEVPPLFQEVSDRLRLHNVEITQ